MTTGWLRRHRMLLAGLAGTLAVLLVGTTATGYLMLRHFNNNISQVNLPSLLGKQSADQSSQGENILVIGADSDVTVTYGDVTTDEPDSIMLLHIAADKKSADLVSFPRNSWVRIPACESGNGQMSSPVQGQLGEAFAIAGQSGDVNAFGAACVIRTLEQETGISIGHLIVASLFGFENMVAALGGVRQCVQAPLTDPNSGITLPAGCQTLTPSEALAYVRARTGSGADAGADLQRVDRQKALVASLFARARSELLNPVAIYRFIDALTSSLTIDSGLGGVTGLYRLEQTLHGARVTQFTLPTHPRSGVVPSGTTDLLWTQPQDSAIFAAIRADSPVSSSLLS